MTQAELIQFAVWAMAAWAIGYAAGLIFVSVRKLLDAIL